MSSEGESPEGIREHHVDNIMKLNGVDRRIAILILVIRQATERLPLLRRSHEPSIVVPWLEQEIRIANDKLRNTGSS